MSVTGKIVNGQIVLPPGTTLPEGVSVIVETFDADVPNDPLVAAVEKLAKPRPHLPRDYALNHGHYVLGRIQADKEITEVLTGEKHFEQAGFTALLK